MTIDRNHPAVEALRREGFDHVGGTMHAWRCEYPDRYPGYCTCPEDTVALVRDNLTADDLRNTPAGRALMAEAWDAGYDAGEADGWLSCDDPGSLEEGGSRNPYKETPDE